VPIVLKSGSLSLLEPSGPVQGCNGIALAFTSITHNQNLKKGSATWHECSALVKSADHTEDMEVDFGCGLDEISLRLRPVAGYGKQGNECSESIKGRTFLELLSASIVGRS
jgi:hypothetical protein